MLHIATVHFASPRWIAIQTAALREHIPVPFMTWTSLQGIDDSYASYFDRVISQGGRHSDKLNHLAIEIAHEAEPEDLLMFLDGDAFPITDPMPLIESGLARAELTAVRREENDGEKQPHPCFCVTTVGFWQRLPGDWSVGYRWPNSQGVPVGDVGGNLLRRLELTNTPWSEILRTNHHNVDPILFAIYGDAIYHHGAGFREGVLTTGHFKEAPPVRTLTRIPGLRLIANLTYNGRRRRWLKRTSQEQVRESARIYAAIQQGGDWAAEFR